MREYVPDYGLLAFTAASRLCWTNEESRNKVLYVCCCPSPGCTCTSDLRVWGCLDRLLPGRERSCGLPGCCMLRRLGARRKKQTPGKLPPSQAHPPFIPSIQRSIFYSPISGIDFYAKQLVFRFAWSGMGAACFAGLATTLLGVCWETLVVTLCSCLVQASRSGLGSRNWTSGCQATQCVVNSSLILFSGTGWRHKKQSPWNMDDGKKASGTKQHRTLNHSKPELLSLLANTMTPEDCEN